MANITFMVGNGFDLNFGLKTSYSDFYDSLNQNTKNRIILNILKRRRDKSSLWADMELGIGHVLSEYSIDDADAFIDDKIEVANLLTKFLQDQCCRFRVLDKQKVSSSLINRLLSISSRLPQRFSDFYQKIIIGIVEQINYSFICFNYTDILDVIIGTVPDDSPVAYRNHNSVRFPDYVTKPLHIHGELESMMVLGVNDNSQIDNQELKNNEIILSDMVKARANEEVGNYNTQNAKKIISASRIIYVYGLSLGATDKMWTQLLFEWLNGSTDRLLIIDYYEENYNTNCTSNIIKWKNRVLNRIVSNNDIDRELFARVRARICIVANTNLFKVDGVAVLDENLTDNDIFLNQ